MLRISYNVKDVNYVAHGSMLIGFNKPISLATNEDHNSALAMDLLGPEPTIKSMVRLAKKSSTFFWVQPLAVKAGGLRPNGFYVKVSADRVIAVKPRPGYMHALLVGEALLHGNTAWGENPEDVLYTYLDQTLNIPLPREWLDYLLGEINRDKLIEEVGVYSGNQPVAAYRTVSVGKLQKAAQEAVSAGLKTGKINFPGFSGPTSKDPLNNVSGLEDYLTKFGNFLADKIAKKHKPLHNPTDPESPMIKHLLRKPYKAQADVIQGLVKSFQRRKSMFLVGEMGTGKTLIAAAVPYLLFERPYRILVMCPSHLVHKWVREIKETVPGATVREINSWQEALRLWDPSQKPIGREYFVISKETTKLGYFERFAGLYYPQKVANGELAEPAWVCPACGSVLKITSVPKSKGKHNTRCETCASPLWTADKKLRKVSVAKIVKRLPSGYFDLAIVDEVHEMKGEDTAQGEAFGAIARKARKVLALTGTLIGGYASDVFYLLWRTDPSRMVREGYEWERVKEFMEDYGVHEVERRYNIRGTKTYERNRPGINPAFFSRHLLESTAFIGLSDLSADLPPFTEAVKVIEMDQPLKEAYTMVEATVKGILHSTKVSIPGYLNALMGYVDRPWGYPPIKDSEGVKDLVTFPDLSPNVLRPKEKELIDIIRAERAAGRKVFVYLVYTDTRDVAGRLQDVLTQHGLRTEVLRSSVPPGEREEWLKKKAQVADVILGNMNLVKTGLDLYDFPTLVFYQTGYQLFSLRQASRRSWRIGQTKPVRVIYMAYKNTIQDVGLRLMGAKLRAAMSLEGKFSAEGLWAMAEGIDVTSELARRLMEGLDGVETAEEIWRPFRESAAIIPLIPVIIRKSRRGKVVLPAAAGQLAWDFGH